MANPLFDLDFLSQLLEAKGRTLYVRITLLTQDEFPLEYIEGKATGGSINVDGSSAVRRSCSISLVAKEVNINDFYWGLKNKFKLEVGIKNDINPNYDDIIWFKQGIYVITSFNTSRGVSNYTINISGKDKMCLLNGDLGGTLPHTTDFGIEEYYDTVTGITTYTPIPIKTIVREAVQNFGGELARNIIINDIEDAGLELLEYRGDIPLYLLKGIKEDVIINMTVNQSQTCYILDDKNNIVQTTIISQLPCYDTLVDLGDAAIQEPTKIKISLDGNVYTVVKVEYGSIPGYRLTDLTYAGDLIANVGETVMSVLDKIKNMLGNFEYFYNLDGKFVFQAKPTYVSIPGIDNEKGDTLPAPDTQPMWSFLNSQLITQFQNTPKLENLRNDFAVWGKKKTTAGSELDIHMRYAIDNKPVKYKALNGVKYTVEEYDWRELIYQMALDYRKHYHDDDFLYNVAQANKDWKDGPLYIDGQTGYEQYYTDLEGFWRDLYNPNADPLYKEENYNPQLNDDICIYRPFRHFTEDDRANVNYNYLYVNVGNQIVPFLGGYCKLTKDHEYGYLSTSEKLTETANENILKMQSLLDIYLVRREFWVDENTEGLTPEYSYAEIISQGGYMPYAVRTVDNNYQKFLVTYHSSENTYKDYQRVVDDYYNLAISLWEKGNLDLYIQDTNEIYMAYNELDDNLLKALYKDENGFKNQIVIQTFDNYGEEIDEQEIYSIRYFTRYYEYDTDTYWHKKVLQNPESLLFWFDFLDAEGSYINKYSTKAVGVRPKAINDNDVKSIYYKEIPQVIFQTGEETYEHQTGYTYIQLQGTMENLFTISSKGKSAKERIEELLYTHGYCVESISLTAIPVYHLEPNSRILVRDDDCGINGEYLVNKITIPLTYNGTMNITATKAVSDII